MHQSERANLAIEACYDAAITPALWPAALQLLAESLGAQSCTFATGDPLGDPIRMPRSEAHEDFAELWLSNEAHAPDPHARACARFRKRRSFILEEDVSTEEERRGLPYYRETARPGNRDWWAAASFPVEAQRWGLQLYRGSARGPFSVGEGAYAASLARHLSKVIGFAEKCTQVSLASGMSALERMKVAALVLDWRGAVTKLNIHAERLMGDDFGILRNRPVAGDPQSNRRLKAFLAASLGARAGHRVAAGPIVIERAGMPWLLVDAIPVTAFGRDLFNSGQLILTLTDLTSPRLPEASLLTIAFGLTRAEARMAVDMASGRGVDDAAALHGIGRETARTQLKAVFAKTNTARQSELVGLLARLPA